jgi:Tol biopolymer transport system component
METALLQVTDNDAREAVPPWSPDGRSIVFASSKDGNYEIYLAVIEQ